MKQTEHITEFSSLAVAEAIEKLQLVKPEAHTVLLNALPHFVDDPKYGLALRKTGTQLNSDEKAQLGIKPRSFMSKELLSQLTPDGLSDPTNSHELTMQRASLTLGRAISLYNAKLGAFPLMARRICPKLQAATNPLTGLMWKRSTHCRPATAATPSIAPVGRRLFSVEKGVT